MAVVRRSAFTNWVAGRLLVAVCGVSVSLEAGAHGFGQRFDLPLPLWLWLTGAGTTIVLTFVLMALFVHDEQPMLVHGRLRLLRFGPVRWVANRRTVFVVRLLASLLFLLTVCAGFFGTANPYANLITTMVWIVWWVGVAFACALIGDLWLLINPWRTIFAWMERAYATLTRGRRLSLGRAYPAWLGAWPAVLAFLAFAWAELVWPDKNVPSQLAAVLLGYTAYTWLGMFVFDPDTWLRQAEAFSLAFGVLARFAPIEFVPASPQQRAQLNLRPFGAGLMAVRQVSWSFMAFVILMLATVTFDGFQETALMQKLETVAQSWHSVAGLLFDLSELGFDETRVVHTLALLGFAVGFVAVYWSVAWISLRWPSNNRDHPPTASRLTANTVACWFVLTLVPIAVAYHLSHYFSLLLTTGQFIIPLASDPFGWGWNLLGTAGYKVNLAVLSPYAFWYSAVGLIVLGHVIAVYLAHAVALRLYGGRAFVREVPMVLLMVAYTSLSLWILAQPIVG
jgi:hypothetical protein